jgi:alkaline phosphatase D
MSDTGRGGRLLKRREFLTTGAMGGVGLLDGPVADLSSFRSSAYPFTLGVASGDPSPDGVVLWTRLAPDPLNGGGMLPIPVLVRWRVALDVQMTRIVRSGLAIAWPSLAHSVHVEVRGLQPGQWYYYQFSAGNTESPLGRTRTLPRRGARVDSMRFAFVSCQNWQHGFYTAYKNLAREDLDLVVHLGDYIYESGQNPAAPRQHDGPETMSLASYRNRHALYKTDLNLQAAHAAFPWFVVPDDHEVENNYAGAVSEDNVDPALFLARRANAYRAYYEHMPLRIRSFPIGPAMRLYRGLTWGDLIRFSALDTRQYRSDQPCGDNIQPRCTDALDPSQTMTGPAQEQWLLGRLERSKARWNVIAQQVMFAQMDFLAGPGQIFNMDQWDGYVAARNRITSFLADARPLNPIVLTGDIHSSWVHNIKTNFDDAASPIVGTEFVGTSISSIFPVPLIGPVFNALADNPHTLFFDGFFRGYVRCNVTPERWLTEFRAVPTVLVEDVPAFTLAAFVVADGQLGAMEGSP